mgnify:CR=1 FL=1
MPVSLQKVNLDLTTANKGPGLDKAFIQINPMSFELNNNLFLGNLNLTQLSDNIHIDGKIAGNIWLARNAAHCWRKNSGAGAFVIAET